MATLPCKRVGVFVSMLPVCVAANECWCMFVCLCRCCFEPISRINAAAILRSNVKLYYTCYRNDAVRLTRKFPAREGSAQKSSCDLSSVPVDIRLWFHSSHFFTFHLSICVAFGRYGSLLFLFLSINLKHWCNVFLL